MSQEKGGKTGAVEALETYIQQYVTFSSPDYAFAAALWAVGTYCWEGFDAFPYLVISSDTKRSGKTRLAEVLSFAVNKPRSFAGMTPAAMFRSIRDEKPTIFIDEAETLSSEAANVMRAVLNVGYRRGQTIPRASHDGIEEWPVYCPKAFILIGDVYDTLRDRSIVVRMVRSEAPRRFVYEHAKSEGAEVAMQVSGDVADRRAAILDSYTRHAGLPFLSDRDEEIWLPLFVLCEALAPGRVEELKRVAVDMATEKTATARRHVDLGESEIEATTDEYARRLLNDVESAMAGRPMIYTADLLAALKAIPTAPWRKFRGDGLTAIDMGNMLSRFGVRPKLIRTGGRRGKVARGYRFADVVAATKRTK